MARLSNGFLGTASGKIGNVVFSKWRRIDTARQYQPDIQDANSPAQIRQRSRMVALLQFLKPLNKNFIQLFNSPLSVSTTPWAVAIKANMSAVSPEGILPLEKFILGDPRFAAPELTDIIFNPFLNQSSFAFNPFNNPNAQTPYPIISCSVLGKYISDAATHEFDTRHLLRNFPAGKFFCSIYSDQFTNEFDNWWAGGLFWMICLETYFKTKFNNVSDGLSYPVFFQTTPIVEGFNTDVKENPVPKEAITWVYAEDASIWSLIFTMDFTKTTLANPANHTLIMWAVSLVDGTAEQSEPMEWDLANNTFTIPIGPGGYLGSSIILYSIFKKTGKQVSCFNRFYIEKGSDDVVYPYFEQLFNCNYSHPASFILPENTCGFTGSIDELFAEFIELWEQGIIHDGTSPAPVIEFSMLTIIEGSGTLVIKNYTHQDGDTYYFVLDTKAGLRPVPDSHFVFSHWSGPDAADIVDIGAGDYKLAMSKERHVVAVFVPE
jgi:hypothetical protein